MSERKSAYDEGVCRNCGVTFRYNPEKGIPTNCGVLACRAHVEWGPDDWSGRARIASARRDAGVGLDGLDEEALRRAGAAATMRP